MTAWARFMPSRLAGLDLDLLLVLDLLAEHSAIRAAATDEQGPR